MAGMSNRNHTYRSTQIRLGWCRRLLKLLLVSAPVVRPHIHGIWRLRVYHGRRLDVSRGCSLLLLLLLREHLTRIKLHQHGAIRLELLYRDRKPEVVQEEELKLEVIELDERKATDLGDRRLATVEWVRSATYLCISRIGVENIGEEFTRTGHARDDQSMDIKTINDEEMREIVIFILWVKRGRD